MLRKFAAFLSFFADFGVLRFWFWMAPILDKMAQLFGSDLF